MNIQIITIGGLNEVGGNCTLYGYKKDFICVDFGIKFNQISYNNPFGTTLPSYKQIEKLDGKIKHILITHAHEDHIGALRHLKDFIKICPEKFDENLKIICNEFNKEVITKKIGKKFNFEVIEVNKWYSFDSLFEYKFIYINHSIPYSNSIIFRTNKNIILHTGDWRIDTHPILEHNHFPQVLRELNTIKLNKHLTVVSDSTNANANLNSLSEREILNSLNTQVLNCIKNRKNIIICFFASNLVRLISIIKIANKHNLKISILSPSVHLFLQIAIRHNLITKNELESVQITEDSVSKYEFGKVILITSGAQGEPNASLIKLIKQENKFIKINSNYCLIYSAKPIPGNVENVINMFSQLSINNIDIINDPSLHASGHPYIDHLEKLYSAIKPNLIIPVHGTFYQMRANGLLIKKYGGKFIMLKNGSSCLLNGKNINLLKSLGDNKCTSMSGELIDSNNSMFYEKAQIIQNGLLIFIIDHNKNFFKFDAIGHYINKINLEKLENETKKIITSNQKKSEIIKLINKYVNFSMRISVLIKIYFLSI